MSKRREVNKCGSCDHVIPNSCKLHPKAALCQSKIVQSNLFIYFHDHQRINEGGLGNSSLSECALD